MTNPIRVLIAEDQSLVRGALVALLDAEPDISVVAECATGVEVAGLVAKHGVDVALLDIEMPGKSGLDAAAELEGAGCRSLIVTTFGRSGYVKRALETGVAGFVVKDTPPEQLAEAIRRVCQMRVFGTGVLGTRYCRVPGSWYRAEGCVGPDR